MKRKLVREKKTRLPYENKLPPLLPLCLSVEAKSESTSPVGAEDSVSKHSIHPEYRFTWGQMLPVTLWQWHVCECTVTVSDLTLVHPRHLQPDRQNKPVRSPCRKENTLRSSEVLSWLPHSLVLTLLTQFVRGWIFWLLPMWECEEPACTVSRRGKSAVHFLYRVLWTERRGLPDI